ncbi:MAG: hypothetical protein L0Z49_05525, partial [Actinobacteria bacterium]|nr:hypothetical protein [Actinomycetota bacterium]
METLGIEDALAVAETRVGAGGGLAGTGFWPAVAMVKRNPELAERYGPRIAAIDDVAFRRRAWLVIPLGLGTVLALLATVGGLALIGWAYRLDGGSAVAVFYLGVIVLLTTTHGLAHLVVGRVAGIRFTAWFVISPMRPQPGVKVDYASYLRATPRARAWMHASGAVATKLAPLALVGAAVAADLG